MIKIIFAFLFLTFLIIAAIIAVQKASKKTLWTTTKYILFGTGCATISVALLTVFVYLF